MIGHVDHGKTTATQAVLKIASEKYGLSKALTFDEISRTPEERERKITIRVSTNLCTVRDKDGNIIHIIMQDCPGHRDYMRNMLSGTYSADIMIVAVSLVKGFEEQTLSHLETTKTVYQSFPPGKQKLLIFLVTSLDQVPEEEREFLFSVLQEQAIQATSDPAFKSVEVIFKSVSSIDALKDPNKCSAEEMIVYRKPFEELIDILAEFGRNKDDNADINSPLFINVEKAVSVTGIGYIMVGSVIRGVVRPGDQVSLYIVKTGKVIKYLISSIQAFFKDIMKAIAGNSIGIRGIPSEPIVKEDLSKGAFIYTPNTLELSRGFTGKGFVMNPIGKNNSGVLQSGSEISLAFMGNTYTCRIIFVDGLTEKQIERVIYLVFAKKAQVRRANDKDSLELQQILASSGFKGAQFKEDDDLSNNDDNTHNVIIIPTDTIIKLPFKVGQSLNGQEGHVNVFTVQITKPITIEVE